MFLSCRTGLLLTSRNRLRRMLAEVTNGFMVVDSGNIYRQLRRPEREVFAASALDRGRIRPASTSVPTEP